ncbi:hypothetical protein QBC38DRAFT_51692 [Podospora fimiseda]|uniref:TauD/TfdA-like domain-containing protein n=1 Tax=Podospora fimiseda TaxID=252190 RepID=A0AAN7GX59_9PEZI|nr:hypothetical protein QBC38DRAFT_51692 [Podospora fimiseda]
MAPYLGQIEDIPESLSLPAAGKLLKAKVAAVTDNTSEQNALSWEGADFIDNEASFIYSLSEVEKVEVTKALESFLALELDGDAVSPDNFHLPTLGPCLSRLTTDLHAGKGFFVIRGLNPADFSDEDNLILFLGLSSYIGGVRGKQTNDGSMLGHLHNAQRITSTQLARPLKYSKRSAEFHNDIGCDIIGMHVRSLAARGGDHLVSSVAKISDHISRIRPDLADALFAPDWRFDLQRHWSDTETRAILFLTDDGRVLSSIIPDALQGVLSSGSSKLTAQQAEALATFQQVATQHQLRIESRPGDLMFINNWAVVHGREAFEDDVHQRRYLVRLWLRNEQLAWPLPEPLRIASHMVFYDETVPEKWNIHHLDDVKFEVYERLAP